MAFNELEQKRELTETDYANAVVVAFTQLRDFVPRAMLDRALKHRAAVESRFIAILKDTSAWSHDRADDRYFLPLHAVMILGLMDSPTAGEALAGALQHSREIEMDLLDELGGYWPALLRNKPDSILPIFEALLESRDSDGYCRIVGADVLVAAAQRQGPSALDRQLSKIAALAGDETEDRILRQHWGSLLLDFPRQSHREIVESIADVHTEHGVMYSMSDVEFAFDSMRDEPEWERFADPWSYYDDDAIAARSFGPDFTDEFDDSDEYDPDDRVLIPESYVRESPKIGRNDPCPCGSGRKYKKCCLREDLS